MSALPTRSDYTTLPPSNATRKTADAAFYDMVAQRLAAGTSGAGTATIAELLLARQSLGIAVPRGHLAGCTLSTAGSSATMSIAAGQAADSTNVVLMDLSAIAKTTSAWAVGTATGGLDTGSIANSTWYNFYVIRRPDTGVVDVVFSTSASAPTLPANYTQYRRIGSAKTNGSAQWTSFVQDGDYFRWLATVNDVASATNPGTAAVTANLTVPVGMNVQAILSARVDTGVGTGTSAIFSDLAANDETPGSTNAMLACIASSDCAGQLQIRTNTSAQIRYRLNASDANVVVNVRTLGWLDTRGRFA